MKLAIIGSRGIPANYGGFETFAEEFSVNLTKFYQYDITVVCDSNQKKDNRNLEKYKGVNLLYSKYSKSENPILFYYDSIKMVSKNNEIIYSCGPAGGMFGFIVTKNKKIMITNPDGLNFKREKWNFVIKIIFQFLEYLTTKFSDYIACDSFEIEIYYNKKYDFKKTFVAEYGAYPNVFLKTNDNNIITTLKKYNLTEGAYHLIVSRLEPENHVHIIIKGYLRKNRKYPLIVVGTLKNSKYVKILTDNADQNIHFLGGIFDKQELSIIRAKAYSYWHGHSVGGTNPSLLEAMASKNLCICHDNVFNRETISDNGLFFKDELSIDIILNRIEQNISDYNDMRIHAYNKIISYYSWKNITKKYDNTFKNIMNAKI